MSHHQHCPCTTCSDAEEAYYRFVERCEAIPLKDWDIHNTVDKIDAYTEEVSVIWYGDEYDVWATGQAVHGDLVEVYDFEIEEK